MCVCVSVRACVRACVCVCVCVKIELVTPLERRCITLSNGVKIMDISHTQPKLLDTEHAYGRKFQTEKNAFEVRGHRSTQSSTLSIQNGRFAFITPFDACEINSQGMFAVEDISC